MVLHHEQNLPGFWTGICEGHVFLQSAMSSQGSLKTNMALTKEAGLQNMQLILKTTFLFSGILVSETKLLAYPWCHKNQMIMNHKFLTHLCLMHSEMLPSQRCWTWRPIHPLFRHILARGRYIRETPAPAMVRELRIFSARPKQLHHGSSHGTSPGNQLNAEEPGVFRDVVRTRWSRKGKKSWAFLLWKTSQLIGKLNASIPNPISKWYPPWN